MSELTFPTYIYNLCSGMVVRDRSKRKNRADEIFKEAKRKGAKKGSFEARRKSKSFAGTGRLLTGESAEPVAPQSPESIVHNIYFWTNGFTVNDGPLRSFDDPANASFLKVNTLTCAKCVPVLSAYYVCLMCHYVLVPFICFGIS
jgi:hypothetical protein